MDTNRSILQRLSNIVSPLSEKSIDALSPILVRTKLKKNEIYLREGEVSNHLYFVDNGLIRQYYFKNGRDLTEHFACNDTVFLNVESYFLSEPTHLLIEALEPTVLYGIPKAPLTELMDESPEIATFYRHFMEYVLIAIQRKIDSFRFETAYERYQRFLRERPEIVRRAPLVHIASYLLMSPETLSRVRSGAI